MAEESEQALTAERAEQLERASEPDTLYGVPVTTALGDQVLHVDRPRYLDLVRALHDDGFVVCVDLTAADYLTHPGRSGLPTGVVPERFEVIVHLLDPRRRRRIRVRCQVPANDPTMPSLWNLYPGTEAPEREVFDLFGITFDGHPDLTRILMPEDWIGHPLRKDYESGRIPVQFKGAPSHR